MKFAKNNFLHFDGRMNNILVRENKCFYSAFTLAEMMVVMLILSIIMAAMAPVMTTRNKLDQSAPWSWATNGSDAYYGLGDAQVAMIGQEEVKPTDDGARLVINSPSTRNHILFKNGDTINGRLNMSNNSILLGKTASGQSLGSYSTGLGSDIGPSGTGSVSVGYANKSTADYSFAGGYNNAVSGLNSIAIGNGNNISGENTIVFGKERLGNVQKNNAIGIGYNFLMADNTVVIGNNARADGVGSVAVGYKARATKTNSIAIGHDISAIREGATGIGSNVNPDGKNSVAIGNGTQTFGEGSIAIGNSIASSDQGSSVSIGNVAESMGGSSIAIGHQVYSSGDYSIGLGRSVIANFDKTIAIGFGAQAKGDNSIAIGPNAKVETMSSDGIAIGNGATVYGNGNIAIGSGACKYATGLGVTCIGNGSGPGPYDAGEVANLVDKNNIMFLGASGTTVFIPGNLIVGSNVYLNSKGRGAIILRPSNARGVAMTLRADDRNNFDREPEYADNLRKYPTDVGPDEQTLFNKYGPQSDRRLKYVGSESTSGLDKIRQLKVFNYTFKKDEKKVPHVGVIAQDLQKVFPNAVKKGVDGFLTIRMEDMFYAMINAIKELDLRYRAQEKRIDELEARIQKLEAKLK